MKVKWTTALMIATFSGALIVGTAAAAANAGGTDNNMLGHEKTGSGTGYGNATKMDFSKLDRNGDGQISQQEAAANPTLAQQFKRLDNNGDGALEKSEFSRFETMEHGTQRNNMKQDTTTDQGQTGTDNQW